MRFEAARTRELQELYENDLQAYVLEPTHISHKKKVKEMLSWIQ